MSAGPGEARLAEGSDAAGVSDADPVRLRSALWDRTTGLASFHLHLDALRSMLDDRRRLVLLHVTCGELGLVESLYGWQVLDRVLRRIVEAVSALKGSALSRRCQVALNGIAGEEILLFEPGAGDDAGRNGGEGPGPETAARLAVSVGRALEDGFAGPEFSTMSPRLTFRVGYALIEDNPQFRFERIVYRALDQARSQQARREQRRQAEWGAELRRLIREDALVTLFQPVVRLEDARVAGWEAFTTGPGSGPLGASGLLFALSERIGAADELDRAGRRLALMRARELPATGCLFLNTRPDALSDPDWRAGAQAERVVIELSETAVTAVPAERLSGLVGPLRRRGYRFALDDAGTGYATRQAVEALRPEFVKIDASLVRDVDRHLLKQELVGSIVRLARASGGQTVAEGVETRREHDLLARHGVAMGQGFLFARPAPARGFAPGATSFPAGAEGARP